MSSRLSISQITTVSATFDADLDAYRAAGADAIGIWESKLAGDSLERFRASGLEAATACPAVPSILQSASRRSGPASGGSPRSSRPACSS